MKTQVDNFMATGLGKSQHSLVGHSFSNTAVDLQLTENADKDTANVGEQAAQQADLSSTQQYTWLLQGVQEKVLEYYQWVD